MGQEVGTIVVAALAQVDLVADPAPVAFGAVAGLRLVWRLHLSRRRRQVLRFAQLEHASQRDVLLDPGPTQHLDRRQEAQRRRGRRPVDRLQQAHAISADQGRVRLARLVPARQTVFLDAAAIALEPLRRRDGPQPVGGLGRDRVQGGPQGLGHLLQAAQHAQGAQHVGRVGTLATAQLEVAARLAGCEQGVEQVPLG